MSSTTIDLIPVPIDHTIFLSMDLIFNFLVYFGIPIFLLFCLVRFLEWVSEKYEDFEYQRRQDLKDDIMEGVYKALKLYDEKK